MASGIVSLAARPLVSSQLADVLLALAGATAIALAVCAAGGLRLARVPSPHVGRNFEYLTCVAGASVLASGLLMLGAAAATAVAWALAGVAAALWVAICAPLLRRLACGWRRSSATGSWMLAVVAPQSLSIVLAGLATHGARTELRLAAMALWALGSVLYLPCATVVLLELIAPGRPRHRLQPDHWILMGAAAISALAAATLTSPTAPRPLGDVRGLLVSAARVEWILAVALAVALTLGEGLALTQQRTSGRLKTARRWATIFPLGMLAICSKELERRGIVAAAGHFAQPLFWVAFAALTVESLRAIRSWISTP